MPHRASRALALAACLVMTVALEPVAFAAEFAHAVPMRQQASGNYYVHGTLTGGVDTEMLVDTGSGYVSLSKATFARVSDQPGTEFVRDIVGAMANGKLLKVPVYRVSELALSAECVLRDIEVVVMPSADRDILGLSALRQVEPFAIRLSTPALWVSDCGSTVAAAAVSDTSATGL